MGYLVHHVNLGQIIGFRSSFNQGASQPGVLTENEIIRISIQLCDVLSHIHNH
jgi:serine/threonine protein kinase